MPAPTTNYQGTYHIDRYLTDYSLSWSQDQMNFIGRRAASVLPVTQESNKYPEYDRGFFWRDEYKRRPLGGRPVQTSKKINEKSYSCEEWGLEDTIDDRQRANTDAPINLEEGTTEGLTQKAMIRMDRIWATNFFTTGVWTTLRQGTASTPGSNQFLQFDDANSDPIGVVDEAKDAMFQLTGFMPNTLVMGAGVRRTLRSHADIADRIKYVGVGLADEAKLQELFDVPNVMTARGLYNTAEEGGTDDFQYIIDEYGMWMGYIEPAPALNKPTAIMTFAWTGLIPGATNAMGGVVERGRDDRAHSDWFQGRMAFDTKLVSADLGVFFQTTVSTSA